jgi:glucose-6-phosphate 1-epimerase
LPQVGTGAAVAIDSTGWEDIVVWNPGQTMPACFNNFVCVENAKFSQAAVVKAGESWRATTTFQVVDV